METLDFLNSASNDDLRILCDIVTKDKDGEYRLTETLSQSPAYKDCYPHNIRGMLPELISEFRRFGGNTVVNLIRKEGPEYSVILRDVAKRNKVNFNDNNSDEQIEQYILQKLFSDSLERASDEDLKQMLLELGYPTTNFSRQAAVATVMLAWKAGGFKSYILLVSVVNAVMKTLFGFGLTLARNAALTRIASIVTGPVGWALTAVWTVVDIAGPAYRVTVPAIIQIAYIRQSINHPQLILPE